MANLRNCTKNVMNKLVYAALSAQPTTSAQRSSVRTFSRTCQLAKSRDFYKELQIPKTATQSEVKTAFYNLSKIYHPDMNKSDEAGIRFREISEAYEVLGNIRSRRMYDKGFGSHAKSSAGHDSGAESEILYEEEEDDAQTKFYKQHMIKSQPPIMADRASARDLDQWASDRISESFRRQQEAKALKQLDAEFTAEAEFRSKQLFCLFSFILVAYLIIYIVRHVEHRKFEAEAKKRNQKGSE